LFNARRASTHDTSPVLELNWKISNPAAHENSRSVVGYFLLSVAKGKTNEIQDWRELQRRFHGFVTKEISAAHDFFCDELEPRDPFPLDCQWICATNKFMNQVNHHLQQWRTQETRSLGITSTFTQFIKPLSNCPGLSEAQQIGFIEKIDTPDLPLNDIHFGRGSVRFD
jgi:hypothetical protein